MLWNCFEKDFPKLDRYHHPNFEPNSGVSDYDEIQAILKQMRIAGSGRSHQSVLAEMFDFMCDHAAIEVNPVDWFGLNIAGWVPDRAKVPFRVFQGVFFAWRDEMHATATDGKQIEALRKKLVECGALWAYPDNDHSKPYWDDILTLGLNGLLQRAVYYRDEKIKTGAYDEKARDFYEAVIQTYTAFIRLIKRFADCAKKHMTDGEKMPYLYRALCNIAENPPQTLYEVMVLTYVYTLVQEYVTGIQTRTLGNIDTLWRPFYEKALADGSLTRDNVKELLKYFYMQYEMAGHPHAQPVFLAGSDRNGQSRVNDLSYAILEAYEEINIISPKLQIAVAKNTPDAFIKKCCDMIRKGHTSLVFANEEIGRASQLYFTDNEDDLNDLSLSGCYNFSLKENIQQESVGTNFVKGIELALNSGVDPTTGIMIGAATGTAEQFENFAQFYDAYLIQMHKLLDGAMAVSDFYDSHMIQISPSTMLSANFEHAVKQGKDVYYDGSKYHNTCITISCLATAVDSLYAIQKYVFDQAAITLPELRDALAVNWCGYEELQHTIANDSEKYGNNIDAVDRFAKELMHDAAEYILSHKNWLGQPYAPDGEGIVHGINFGKKTGATPDGRNAGDQLSKNLQAVFGCDTKGITAYINSVTKINAVEYPNGAPIDFVLHPTSVEGEAGLDIMLALVRTTFKKGGSALQGNVYSAEMLKDAQQNPDKYKGLQVRLCGWSQYFNRLSRDEQDMMIRQAESV